MQDHVHIIIIIIIISVYFKSTYATLKTGGVSSFINKDLKKIWIGWDEVQEATDYTKSWWIHVASVFDAGGTRNQDTQLNNI